MSLSAARAMDDLADCLEQEAADLSFAVSECLAAMARAHRKTAKLIRERAERAEQEIGGKVECPPEYRPGQAGTRRD